MVMRNGRISKPNGRKTTSELTVGAIGANRGAILYLDEQHLTRDCISRELERHLPELNIVGHATAQDVAADDAPDAKFLVAVLYVHADHTDACGHHKSVDDGKTSAELARLEQLAPDVPRVLLSDVEVPEDIIRAFRRRIRGYVPTTLPIRQVAEAIRFVVAGGTFVPPSILSLSSREVFSAESRVKPNPSTILANFSPRQNEVLRRLWRGSANKLIAYELSMCESTVKVHIRHIMKKLNVSNRTQVVLRTRPLMSEDGHQANGRDDTKLLRSPALADKLSAIQPGNCPHGGAVIESLNDRTPPNSSH